MPKPIVTTTSPALSRELVTLAAAKSRLGITDASQDAEVRRVVRAASGRLEGALGRPIRYQTYTIQQAGHGGRSLRVPRFPVAALPTSIALDGATVSASGYAIGGDDRADRFYAADGWEWTADACPLTGDPAAGTERLDYLITGLPAGWAAPVVDWTAATVVERGWWARPVATPWEEGGLLFRTSASGTTDATEPTWPTTAGGTVTDNDITWTAIQAPPLLYEWEEAVLGMVAVMHGGVEDLSSVLSSHSDAETRIVYRDTSSSTDPDGLSPATRALVERWK